MVYLQFLFFREKLQGGFLEVFILLFGQLSVDLSEELLAKFVDKTFDKVFNQIWETEEKPKENHGKSKEVRRKHTKNNQK